MSTGKPTAHTTGGSGSFITKQPGKALWTLLAIVSTSVKFPLWLLYYIPKSLRQHQSLSYKQAVLSAFVKHFLYHTALIHIQTPTPLEPGKEKERFVVMQPSKEDLYQGVLKDAEIKPTAVGGTWYPSLYSKGDSPKKVVLHFHGGAYVIGTGRERDAGFAAKLLVEHVAEKAFLPQYRLSSKPGGRFPAALQDAVTSYQYLLDLGIPASSIVVSGDSAGGNLAITLLRYLTDHKGLMPAPSAALLWSPWVNLVGCNEAGIVERNRNFATDYLTSPLIVWGTRGFVPDFMEANNPYISPYNAPFATETPLWVQTCSLETLRDDDEHFAKVMKGVHGNRVEFHEEPGAPHDILLTGDLLGMEAKAGKISKLARKFLDSL